MDVEQPARNSRKTGGQCVCRLATIRCPPAPQEVIHQTTARIFSQAGAQIRVLKKSIQGLLVSFFVARGSQKATLAIDQVLMDLNSERGFDLRRGTLYRDPVPALGDAVKIN